MKIIISLTDVEVKALENVMSDPVAWTENAIKERARIAMEEIVALETQRMINDPTITSIPATIEEIIMAYEPPIINYSLPTEGGV